MKRTVAALIVATLACTLLPACDSQKKSATLQLSASDTQTLERLYAQATGEPQYRRAHRKPVRDLRARAMHQLAEKAEVMLAEHRVSAEALALTGDHGENADACAAYEQSLADLAAAAQARDRAAVRAAYARVAAAQP